MGKKGLKRAVEELVGDGTLSRYVESLRVPDWTLVHFQAKAKPRVSFKTWQTVINITGLERTGVRIYKTVRIDQVYFTLVIWP